ncbi:hypothetical protein AAFF_G00420750 [Aldrovandia affinis]|uniref:Uncharacterized protein n=1 Tax=Aldrovandia affinis TaxID=143900 RepID=A0AAD7WIV1_9TELE|nr:hypothetical protein AAFF_G00420750 [Aldrovandia affinis]
MGEFELHYWVYGAQHPPLPGHAGCWVVSQVLVWLCSERQVGRDVCGDATAHRCPSWRADAPRQRALFVKATIRRCPDNCIVAERSPVSVATVATPAPATGVRERDSHRPKKGTSHSEKADEGGKGSRGWVQDTLLRQTP